VKTWKINELDTRPRKPEILDSTDDARAIVIDLPAGDSLEDHEVHERAWLVVVKGQLEVTALTSSPEVKTTGGPGLLVEFEPRERHRVDAHHPGALTIEEKAHVRERASKANEGQ